MAITTSIPPTTLPKTENGKLEINSLLTFDSKGAIEAGLYTNSPVCLLSNQGVGTVVMKNCDPEVGKQKFSCSF